MRRLAVVVGVALPLLVSAADGTVTPEFMCQEFAGTSSSSCLKCAAKILPKANLAVERCEARCNARYQGDELEVCKIDCLGTYEVHFKNNCMR